MEAVRAALLLVVAKDDWLPLANSIQSSGFGLLTKNLYDKDAQMMVECLVVYSCKATTP